MGGMSLVVTQEDCLVSIIFTIINKLNDVTSAEFCVQFLALFHGQDHLVLTNFIR